MLDFCVYVRRPHPTVHRLYISDPPNPADVFLRVKSSAFESLVRRIPNVEEGQSDRKQKTAARLEGRVWDGRQGVSTIPRTTPQAPLFCSPR